MRIVFVGCVKEGWECCSALLHDGVEISAVITFVDEIRERLSGGVPFDSLASRFGVPLYKVQSINASETVDLLRRLAPDLLIVIGWTEILRREALSIPTVGCIGMHASLLPRYRGGAPVNWAIINGETATGNTMFFLDAGVDTGDILAQRPIEIAPYDTCGSVYDKVAQTGIEMLREALPRVIRGQASPLPQEALVGLPSRMSKRRPEDGLIRWNKEAWELYNWIRALTHPYPGAFAYFGKRKIFIWEAIHLEIQGFNLPVAVPGAIIGVARGVREGARGVLVATRTTPLLLTRVQFDGEEEVDACFLADQNILQIGERFTDEPAGSDRRGAP